MSYITFKQDMLIGTTEVKAGQECLVFFSYFTPKGVLCGVDLSFECNVYHHVHLLETPYEIRE